ncbi:uncharacterized protein LOC115576546 [Sparus aurata]|uniref:uncharacterized protein LOC115576546 n=1 Tax=Sparus aurata TaxID=8175 RepID=UPI0011C0EC00|nr:uncharacterized protein LOC115576546 [Sparus aurata]
MRSRTGEVHDGSLSPACSDQPLHLKLSTISSTKRPVTGNCSSELKTLKFGFINIRSLSTKALLINNLITEHKLDMIGLCETWLKPNTFLPLNEASPLDYNYAHVARASKQGGGVALIYKSILSLSSNQDIKFTSFEALVLKPSSSNSNSLVQGTGFHLVVLYRPPGPYSQFLEEFGEFIADLVTRSDKILIIGDFNIHLNKPSDPLGKAFLRLLDISNFIQLVHEPTHSSGNTLDLIISHGLDVSALNVASVSSAVSDHFLITFEASLACPYVHDTNVVTSHRINPAITATLSDKVPGVLAPFATRSGSPITTPLHQLINSPWHFDNDMRHIPSSFPRGPIIIHRE